MWVRVRSSPLNVQKGVTMHVSRLDRMAAWTGTVPHRPSQADKRWLAMLPQHSRRGRCGARFPTAMVLSVLLLAGAGQSVAQERPSPSDSPTTQQSESTQPEAAITKLPTVLVSDTAIHPKLAEGDDIQLDQPTPTGSRLGVTIREVPGSVNVVTSRTMQQRGQSTTLRALENAVGVATGNCFGIVCFSMRGFADVLSLPFLVNGNRYPGLAVPPRSTFTYDSVEVVKGASSLLHGLGSVIGAMNFVTKKATGANEHVIEAAYGHWNTRRIGLGAGGKIGDNLAYRLDGHYAAADNGSYGFVDRTRYEDFHISGEMAWDITSRFRASVSLDAFRDRGEGYFGTPLVNGRIDKRIIRNNYNVDDDRIVKDVLWTRVNLAWELLNGLTLRNESYVNLEKREWKNAEAYAYNATTGLVDRGDFLRIDHDNHLYGNRLDALIVRPIGPLDNTMVVGAELSFNRHQRDNNSPFGGADSVDFLNPTPGFFSTPDPVSAQRRTKVGAVGLYIEDLLKLTDSVKLAAGYRRDISRVKSFDLRNSNNDFTQTYHGNSWRLGLLYDLLPTVTLYGQWSGAAEPPSQITTLTVANKNFNLTKSRQWEVGIKGSFFDNRTQVTLAFFDLSRRNMLTRDTSDPNTVQQIGKQSSQGMELALALRPTRQWSIDANVALIDAQFDRFADSAGGVSISRKGNRPQDVPEVLANAWIMYRPLEPLRIGVGAHFVGARWADRANTVNMEEYVTVDAVLAYTYSSGEVSIHGRNLNDTLYANRSYNNGSQVLLGESRAWEVIWRMNF